MYKFVNTTQSDYLVISKDFLRYSKLGFAEIGLLVKLMAMPDGFVTTTKALADEMHEDKSNICKSMEILKDTGYVSADESPEILTYNVSDRKIYAEENEKKPFTEKPYCGNFEFACACVAKYGVCRRACTGNN